MDYNELKKMLEDFKNLNIPHQSRRKTFMDVSGYPHYENVVSNILAFFFNDSEEHGFGNLWLNSLLSCAKGVDQEDDNVTVDREVFTSKNKRIDLIVTSDHYILCIENKIFADVYNDLNDYADYVSLKEETKHREQVNIVLSLFEQRIPSQFCNVTYAELFDAVRQRLGMYIDQSDSTWILYMRDFIATIESLQKGSNDMNIDFEQFYMQNYPTITKLNDTKTNVFASFTEEAKQVREHTMNYLQEDDRCAQDVPFDEWKSPKIMRCCFFTDFYIPNAKETYYSIETSRYACGWCINLYERHCNRSEAINWLQENQLPHCEVRAHTKETLDPKKHHVIYDFPIKDSTFNYTDVAKKVYELIIRILETGAVFSLYREKK